LLFDLDQVLLPRDAHLSAILDTDADGTQWSYQASVPSQPDAPAHQPALAAHGATRLAMTWVEGNAGSPLYAAGDWIENGETVSWQAPVELMMASAGSASHPQVTYGPDGKAHVIWLEQDAAGDQSVVYALCEGSVCSDGRPVIGPGSSVCEGAATDALADGGAIAVDGTGTVLAVWGDSAGNLAYASWEAGEEPLSPALGCLATAGGVGVYEPRLATSTTTHQLIYSQTGEPDGPISIRRFRQGAWQAAGPVIGNGSAPEIWTDSGGEVHAVWCTAASGAVYWDQTTAELVAVEACNGRPAITQDSDGNVHVTFYSDELVGGSGLPSERDVLYETIRTEKGWTAPMIVALPGTQTQPALVASSEGTLHLAWTDAEGGEALAYATQGQYGCAGYEPGGAAGAAIEVSRQPQFRSQGSELAYCQNRYDRLVFAPNPAPAFSSDPPTAGGVYDVMAELASTARYEVLIATMAYEQAVNGEGPGMVIGRAVSDLYDRLRTDPGQYPRGLTVRILLGNSPPFATMELNSQLWELLSDLREAGVDTMVAPEIGWRLEVANFEGSFPHSHTKLMVVDGKSMIASGFNIEHRPMPIDSASGRGGGDTDLGIQVTGPVAQDGRRVFDDLWDGAVQRHCSDFHPVYQVWQATCRDRAATVDHVPEVLRYYLAGGDAIALSMFRSYAHPEADEQVYAALSSAEESIDVLHVSFTYSMLCTLNHFFDLCTAEQDPEYIERILEAAADNSASVRILVGVLPFQGTENVVAVELMRQLVEQKGLSDRVEFRFFDGLVHVKSMLIDGEFLVVGSQNLHYSAFGDGGLAEYNLGVTDPQAIDDYRRMFDHMWDQAIR
jgi:phosphatidylserine/phosphatidylglycerophosphate/cardiolipin synthase-like enzyme